MNLTTKQSLVYVIQAQGTSLCKLGVTTDLASRLRSIQTGCPHKCIVLATWPGSTRLEAKLHKHFAEYRRAGEWFELPPFCGKQILDIVTGHCHTGEFGRLPVRQEPCVRDFVIDTNRFRYEVEMRQSRKGAWCMIRERARFSSKRASRLIVKVFCGQESRRILKMLRTKKMTDDVRDHFFRAGVSPELMVAIVERPGKGRRAVSRAAKLEQSAPAA